MAKIAIGIDLGGTDIKAGTVTLDGRVLSRWKKSTEAQGGAQVILQRMMDLTEEILKDAKSHGLEAVGIGIGSPGVIDNKNGIVVKMIDNLPGWSGMPLAEKFHTRFGLPTQIDNDANVFALGECLFGAGRGKSDIVCYTLGTGVGGGIVINRKVHHGVHGYAGELGHGTVEIDGLQCSCGNKGCVEMYSSAKAIGLYAQERLRAGDASKMAELAGSIDQVTSKTVYEASLKGDALAKAVVARAGYYLGAAIAGAICYLNPDMVIIGGGGSKMGDVLFDSVREEIRKRVYFSDTVETPLVGAQLGEDAAVIGAAGLVL